MANYSEVPAGWAECTLPDVCHLVMGQSPPSSTYNTKGRGLPFFQGKKEFGERFPRVEVWCHAPGKIAEAGSVLMSIRAPVGPTNIAKHRSCIGRGLAALHPHEGVERDFLLYLLRRHERSLSGQGTGSTFNSVTKGFLERYRVHLAPLVEQRAIVAKIESLFSELDHGVAQLETARAQLGRYRQSVLKAAFEGRLTATWREQRRRQAEADGEPLPTADDLLARIRAEREAAHAARLAEWERAVAAWEAAGGKQSGQKKPRKPKAPKEPPPLTRGELAGLADLPDDWVWTRLGDLFAVHVGATPSRSNPSYWGGSVPWISSGEVAFRDIAKTSESISLEGLESASTRVHPIGTVYLAMIGEGKTRGQAAIARIAACHNQNTAAICVSETSCDSRYVFYRLMLDYERNRLVGNGNNQKALNKSRVQAFSFPLCDVGEQVEVVNQIELRLSVVDEIERTIDAALEHAKALRQSILKKAFEGRLLSEAELAAVRADPAYEPADQLLARIREQTDSLKLTKKTHRKRKAAKARP